MGYTHYFEKRKDIPDPQWQALCDKVSEAFIHLPKVTASDFYRDYPVALFNASGEKRITEAKELFMEDEDNRFIVFNGDASQGLEHESFVLRQKAGQGICEWFCKTARKPYDWFAVTVLILLHNLCPECYEVTSDG
ncbi:MAG: hypothetical protein ACRCWR_07155, partial [Saezia sp.]